MEKIIRSLACVAISIVVVFTANAWSNGAVSAESLIQPRWSYTNYTATGLNISTGGTAACAASATGYYGTTTKVHIEMHLQQYLALQWTTIGSWEGTFNKYYGTLDKSKTLTSSGNYRVKAVYTVYAGSASEKITMYSQEKYYTRP